MVLNLQPTARLAYDRTTTGEWLAHCGACPVPEYSNAFERSRRARAAGAARTFKHSRFGFLGNTYGGMLDLYSDLTMVQAQTGLHLEVLEIGDLQRRVHEVTTSEVAAKRDEVMAMFDISDDSPSDPIARRPTDEQMEWSCRVAAGQERIVREFDLDALEYYYHGATNSAEERLVGGSFTEIVAVDYDDDTIILGHDGPFHMAIAEGRPVLRGLGLYHGKQGTGVSVEAKVRTGAVTTLNVTQTADGRLKLISSEGASTDGPTMQIGNTQTPVRFSRQPDEYMSHWFAHAPTHHCAMSVGHNASSLRRWPS